MLVGLVCCVLFLSMDQCLMSRRAEHWGWQGNECRFWQSAFSVVRGAACACLVVQQALKLRSQAQAVLALSVRAPAHPSRAGAGQVLTPSGSINHFTPLKTER